MIYFPAPAKLAAILPKAGGPFVPFFLAAGATEQWPAELLAAICWRESHFGVALTPPGPAGVGDNGHGRGLMQLDDRSHGHWLERHDWRDPGINIDQGATILSSGRALLSGCSTAAIIAAYNAGPARVRAAVLTGQSPDSVTTGKDYSEDVLVHARTWHALAKNGVGGDCTCCLCRVE